MRWVRSSLDAPWHKRLRLQMGSHSSGAESMSLLILFMLNQSNSRMTTLSLTGQLPQSGIGNCANVLITVAQQGAQYVSGPGI